MSNDVVLPHKYALVLLRKLADDDLFRHHYELSPAQALKDIGVPDEILSQVPSENFKPVALAEKGVFLQALLSLIDETAYVAMCLVQPHVNAFSPIKGSAERAKVSFEAH